MRFWPRIASKWQPVAILVTAIFQNPVRSLLSVEQPEYAKHGRRQNRDATQTTFHVPSPVISNPAIFRTKWLEIGRWVPFSCRSPRLRHWLADHPCADGATLFPIGSLPTSRWLKIDLAAAEIPFRDAEGKQVDFHALRVSFISNLARAGVAIQVARDLARHSTVELTSRVYTRLELRDLAGAVERLPAVQRGPNEAIAQRATGTHGVATDDPKNGAQYGAHFGASGEYRDASRCTEEGAERAESDRRQVVSSQELATIPNEVASTIPLPRRRNVKAGPLGLEPMDQISLRIIRVTA